MCRGSGSGRSPACVIGCGYDWAVAAAACGAGCLGRCPAWHDQKRWHVRKRRISMAAWAHCRSDRRRRGGRWYPPLAWASRRSCRGPVVGRGGTGAGGSQREPARGRGSCGAVAGTGGTPGAGHGAGTSRHRPPTHRGAGRLGWCHRGSTCAGPGSGVGRRRPPSCAGVGSERVSGTGLRNALATAEPRAVASAAGGRRVHLDARRHRAGPRAGGATPTWRDRWRGVCSAHRY